LLPLSPERYGLVLLGRVYADYKAHMFLGQLFPLLQVKSPLHSLVSDYTSTHIDPVLGIIIHVSEHEQHIARVVTGEELLDPLLEGRSLGDIVQTEDTQVRAHMRHFTLYRRIHGRVGVDK